MEDEAAEERGEQQKAILENAKMQMLKREKEDYDRDLREYNTQLLQEVKYREILDSEEGKGEVK